MKYKKIFIIELYGHHLFCANLAKISVLAGFNVFLCISESLYDDIYYELKRNNIKCTIIIKNNKESFLSYFKKIKLSIDDSSLVCFCTIQGYAFLKYLLFNVKSKKIMANGRLSEWFEVPILPINYNSVRNIIYHFYSKILKSYYKLIIDGMILHTDRALEIVKLNKYSKSIMLLPYAFKDDYYEIKIKEKTNITIGLTGSVNPLSRDYLGFLNYLLGVKNQSLLNINFVILNEIPLNTKYGQNCKYLIEKLIKNGYNIKFYSSWISEKNYQKGIEESDFLLALIKHKKYYNKGELTSSVVDCIRKSKPIICPNNYITYKNINNCTIYYDDYNDLHEKLSKISNNINLVENYKQEAEIFASLYSIDKFIINYRSFINSI